MFRIAFCNSESVRRPSIAKASYCLSPVLEKLGRVRLKLRGLLVEILSEAADQLGGAADLAVAVSAAGEILQAFHHLVEPLRILGERRGDGLDVVQRHVQRHFIVGDHAVDTPEDIARLLQSTSAVAPAAA